MPTTRPACGRELPGGQRYCGHCGADSVSRAPAALWSFPVALAGQPVFRDRLLQEDAAAR